MKNGKIIKRKVGSKKQHTSFLSTISCEIEDSNDLMQISKLTNLETTIENYEEMFAQFLDSKDLPNSLKFRESGVHTVKDQLSEEIKEYPKTFNLVDYIKTNHDDIPGATIAAKALREIEVLRSEIQETQIPYGNFIKGMIFRALNIGIAAQQVKIAELEAGFFAGRSRTTEAHEEISKSTNAIKEKAKIIFDQYRSEGKHSKEQTYSLVSKQLKKEGVNKKASTIKSWALNKNW